MVRINEETDKKLNEIKSKELLSKGAIVVKLVRDYFDKKYSKGE